MVQFYRLYVFKLLLLNITKYPTRLFLYLALTGISTACCFHSVDKKKKINYGTSKSKTQELNVFYPKKTAELKEVLIFIHGGNWRSGDKSIYNFFGKRFAKKGIVTVIIGYPHEPPVTYDDMATSTALAVLWVKNNIQQYGGNPDKIFISGHSAGGHLASLVSIRNEYFDSLKAANPIKGTIMIDAAGQDMYDYLKKENLKKDHHYFRVFTSNPTIWKEASPLYHLHKGMPKMLIYQGEKTYTSIKVSNQKFVTALKEYVSKPNFHIIKNKGHIPMILQFYNSDNPIYKEMIDFMKE